MFYFPHIWINYPALFYGLCFFIGIAFAMTYAWWLVIPCLVLGIPFIGYFRSYKEEPVYFRFIFGVFAVLGGFLLFTLKHDLPEVPMQGIYGEGVFEIEAVSSKNHFFGRSWIYKGNLSVFNVNGSPLGYNIPVSIYIPNKKGLTHPPGNGRYVIGGRLKQSTKGNYSIALNYDEPWKKVDGSWGLAEIRYECKKWVKGYIENRMGHSRSARFLTGMATGEFDDRLMAFEFSRFGLQHLMAISGFHFGIIAYFLSLLARMVLPPKCCPWVLIVGLSLYFLFLGMSASVMRSWVGAMVFFAGQLIEKESNGLNALGVALLLILAIDPLAVTQMGFQFSFATTAAILIFFSPSQELLNRYLPKRSFSNVIQMGMGAQHAYLVLNFFKNALALTMAVSIVAIPMTIFYFGKFPLLSLIYNLFYPFLASISMLFFMLGILLAWIPPLSQLIHSINAGYTEFLLDFTYGVPTYYDYYLKFYDMNSACIVAYLCVIYFAGLALKFYRREEGGWTAPLP